jgi:hypothetical protein
MQGLDQAAAPERGPSREERNPQVLSLKSEDTITKGTHGNTQHNAYGHHDIGHYDSEHWTFWTHIVISHLYRILSISLQSPYTTQSCSSHSIWFLVLRPFDYNNAFHVSLLYKP